MARVPQILAPLATAAALALATPAGAAPAEMSMIPETAFGEWNTQDGKARVRIQPCDGDSLCGHVVWLRTEAQTGKAARSPSGSMLKGARILEGFKRTALGWVDGRIFAINRGKIYRANVAAIAPDKLRVEGCAGPLCGSQVWTRASTMSATAIDTEERYQTAARLR